MGATQAAARRRRIIYEASKRFCNDVFFTTYERAPNTIHRIRATTCIQRWFKSVWALHVARMIVLRDKQATKRKEESLKAAKRIQKCFCLYRDAKLKQHIEQKQRGMASTVISSMVRRKLSIFHANKLRHERIIKINCSKAIIIQCFARRTLAKKSVLQRKERGMLVLKAMSVLRRCFLAHKSRRRRLEDESAMIIQKTISAYANRRIYIRIKAAALCIQKYARMHLTRCAYLSMQNNSMKEDDHTAKICHALANELPQLEATQHPPPPISNACHPNCSIYNVEICHNKLACEDEPQPSEETSIVFISFCQQNESAQFIQQWYRQACNARLAASVVTRSVRMFLSNKREKEESRRKTKESRHRAAIRIQTLVRVFHAELKVCIALQNLNPGQLPMAFISLKFIGILYSD